jgi:hypothetical protein
MTGVISGAVTPNPRSRKSKDSQYNNEKKKDKNDKQFSAKHYIKH